MPVNGASGALALQFGLISAERRYLTAEAFGFEVNAAAGGLKRKQTWTLERDAGEPHAVHLRSHLGRYLSSDADGRVSCAAEAPGDASRFRVLPQSDGRWALQSQAYLRYLGAAAGRLSCFAQTVGGAELWAVHLALHPIAALRSVSRRRYARLSPDGAELRLDADAAWGVPSLLTLAYLGDRYGLKTSDGRFLSQDGALLGEAGRGAGFTLDIRAGGVAFKDCEGKYLAPAGPAGTLRAGRCSKPGKDELFHLLESHPQVVLQTPSGKYVSIRQGVNISANQDDETDMETFQMEIDGQSRKCTFRSKEGNYWTLVSHGGIQSTATEVAENTMFELQWMGRRVAMKASNGKYVCTKKNGQLAAVSDTVGEDEQLLLKLTNRPVLILRGENGFVCQHKGSNTLDTSRTVYDSFTLLYSQGAYHISGVGGFWFVASSGLVCCDGETPEDFSLELRERGRLAIRTQAGRYLRGDQGGTLKADAQTPEAASLWEY